MISCSTLTNGFYNGLIGLLTQISALAIQKFALKLKLHVVKFIKKML